MGRKNPIGRLFIVSGIGIIMYLILPTELLWFLIAVGLICFGMKLSRCR